MAKISELTPAEQSWLATQLQAATDFVWQHAAADELTLEALDRAWAAWLAINEVDMDSVNAVINAVGIAFGQALVDSTKLRWVIASDEQGTDLALFALPGRGDVLVYPANLVAKRWEQREPRFLGAIHAEIASQVTQLAAAPDPAPAKPWWKLW